MQGQVRQHQSLSCPGPCVSSFLHLIFGSSLGPFLLVVGVRVRVRAGARARTRAVRLFVLLLFELNTFFLTSTDQLE